MSVQAEKLKLIEWLVGLQDKSILERLKWLKEDANSATDWWDEISQTEKDSIERGLKDSQAGNTIPHDQVKARYAKYL
ncbi:MAG: hypothetical protein KDB74_02695 [Flavobacteriales bacterium]|nr:hypothetical protein [Flavobacteriales bacterium]